jgi:hypothetical protein
MDGLSFYENNAPSRLPNDVESFVQQCASTPSSTLSPSTTLDITTTFFQEHLTKDPFYINHAADAAEAYLYKKVANKTCPVATTLPENFQIIRHDHPDPLAGMPALPPRPPDFVPTGRFTLERRNQMPLGREFLWPEEVKLAEWIVCVHNTAFAWTDDERGSFDPKYFAPIEIPHISHIPWVLRQGPIPRGILDEVTKIIKWPKLLPFKPPSQRLNNVYTVLTPRYHHSQLPSAIVPLSIHLPTMTDIPRL